MVADRMSYFFIREGRLEISFDHQQLDHNQGYYSWQSIFAVNVLQKGTAKFETAKFIPQGSMESQQAYISCKILSKCIFNQVLLRLFASSKSHSICYCYAQMGPPRKLLSSLMNLGALHKPHIKFGLLINRENSNPRIPIPRKSRSDCIEQTAKVGKQGALCLAHPIFGSSLDEDQVLFRKFWSQVLVWTSNIQWFPSSLCSITSRKSE